jgi:lipoprotein-anchoring transpeptidase ErfK/SrfK
VSAHTFGPGEPGCLRAAVIQGDGEMFKRMRLLLCLIFAAGFVLWTADVVRAQRILRPAEPPAAETQSDEQAVELLEGELPIEPPTTQPDSGFITLLGRSKPAAATAPPPPAVSNAVALQIALDRAGFSPGLVDGNPGRKTQVAIAAFQQSAGLPATGKLDAATQQALAVGSQPLVQRYTLTGSDIASVGPWPKDWNEKSKVKRLGYKSVAAMVAERGHCSLAMLARLNPGVDLDSLQAGDAVWLPYIGAPAPTPKAACIEIDLGQKVLRVLDKSGKVAALFHCSIAKDKAKLPKRSCKVAVVAPDPIYIFDPKMWPEVKNVHRKLVIPPGPRNPVGLCWIGLSLDGYGIHGTPEPEMIGKTGSHGCIRLANWDAQRLGKMARVGMDVRFTNSPTSVAMKR